MGKPRDPKVAILPSTTRKGTTLSTSSTLDSPSVISQLVSPQASLAGTSLNLKTLDNVSAVLDDSGSLGSFLDATIARSRQIENAETPNENATTPVNSPELDYSSDDPDEDYVELNDDFINRCNATDARKIKKFLTQYTVRHKLSPDPKFATSPICIKDKDYDFSLDLSHIAIVEKAPFCGTEKESAVEHMIEISSMSSLFSDDVKMRTYFVAKNFPFSLKDDAKTWKRTPDEAEELLARISRNHDDWNTPEPTPTPILKKRGLIELNDEDMREAKKSLKEKDIKSEDVKNLPPIEDICEIIPPSSMIEDPLYPEGHPKRIEQDSQRIEPSAPSKKKKKKKHKNVVESSEPVNDPNSISISDAETESGNEHDNGNDNDKNDASDKEEVEDEPEKHDKNKKYTKEDFIAKKHGAAELTTPLLRLSSILFLPLCRINKLGYTTREDCCDPLYLWVIKDLKVTNPKTIQKIAKSKNRGQLLGGTKILRFSVCGPQPDPLSVILYQHARDPKFPSHARAVPPPADLPQTLPTLVLLLLLTTATQASTGGEREALLRFKAAVTSEPGGLLRAWTPASPSHCRWPGITCGPSGSVISLTLPSSPRHRLSGALSPSIATLRNLRILALPSHALAGALPPAIWTLRRLQTLDLSGNRLHGEIPRSLPYAALHTLDLAHNALNGSLPAALGSRPAPPLPHLQPARRRHPRRPRRAPRAAAPRPLREPPRRRRPPEPVSLCRSPS
ncbi:hypothetical protein QYE76_014589 [Lolium multiflorum]|uniref:Leucine-rich repeat-containing N-terminal plant-type domain-containing protein n=1 Tax=Lolium multiflorum TaxID=4521 RepID=A0AAD8X8B5_LOLMU|nr:hypothetical protein QYE76_014589 [Lolium multiflorum]